MINSYLCDAHRSEAVLFCLCESDALFTCPNCLPKHMGHEIYPVLQYELFQVLGKDKEELKRRNSLSQKCQVFLDRVEERETAVQFQAKTLMNTLSQNYGMWLEGNHRCFDSLLTTLREDTALLLTRPKYRVSSITQKLFEKLETLDSEGETRFSQIPEIETLKKVSECCHDALSRTSKVWQEDYESEVLQSLIQPRQANKRIRSSSFNNEEVAQLTLKLEELACQLQSLQIDFQAKTQYCLSLEEENQTLRKQYEIIPLTDSGEVAAETESLESRFGDWGITRDPSNESPQSFPDNRTPQSKSALSKFGPYQGQDSELILVKRGRIIEETGVYIGHWNTRNKKHGFGQCLYSNGDMYEGLWRNGNMTGKGRYIWTDGTVYIGDFLENKKEGFGTSFYANGDVYSGAWSNDKKHGVGSFTLGGTLDRYIGEYLDGERSGIGARFWPDGRMHVGYWKSDALNGAGLMGWRNPESMYFGEFVNEARSGMGCNLFPNGDVYTGEWKDGNMSGQGKLTHPGSIEEGVWVENVVQTMTEDEGYESNIVGRGWKWLFE